MFDVPLEELNDYTYSYRQLIQIEYTQKNTVEKLQSRVDSIARLLNQKTISSAALVTSANTLDINPLYKSNSIVATENTIRDKTMLSTIFAAATQNLELAKFTLNQETPVIQIVDAPSLPLKIVKKSKLMGAIAFSLIFGVLYVFIIFFKRLINNNSPSTNYYHKAKSLFEEALTIGEKCFNTDHPDIASVS